MLMREIRLLQVQFVRVALINGMYRRDTMNPLSAYEYGSSTQCMLMREIRLLQSSPSRVDLIDGMT